MDIHNQLIRLSSLAGLVIGGFKLNRLIMIRETGRQIVLKRRRWYTPMVTFGGNIYTWILGLKIRVLHNREWLQREQMLYRRLYGETVVVHRGGWLSVPYIGDALSIFLSCSDYAMADKLKALVAVTLELHRIHGISVGENGVCRRFSHGDACARNVAYSRVNDLVHWFDFEIVHSAACSDSWRHADDLRALLFSSLACLPESVAGEAIRVVLDTYGDERVLHALHERVVDGKLELDTYHLAQLRMDTFLHGRLTVQLQLALEQRLPGLGSAPISAVTAPLDGRCSPVRGDIETGRSVWQLS